MLFVPQTRTGESGHEHSTGYTYMMIARIKIRVEWWKLFKGICETMNCTGGLAADSNTPRQPSDIDRYLEIKDKTLGCYAVDQIWRLHRIG